MSIKKIVYIAEIIAVLFVLGGCATTPHNVNTMTPSLTSVKHYLPVTNIFLGKRDFAWPVHGYVIAPFGTKVDNVINKGINIKSEEGASVRAAKAGKIVYCDTSLKGLGKTIIIDHGDGYETVYAYNSDILVKVGDEVMQNTVIARAGRTGRAKAAMLHFEVRRNGEPQNPMYYLSH